MTPVDAFKAGFVLACGDMGLSGQEASQLASKLNGMTKQALVLPALFGKFLFSKDVSRFIDSVTGPLVALPVAAGVGVGSLIGRMTTAPLDEDEIKKREIIQELREQAERLRKDHLSSLVLSENE